MRTARHRRSATSTRQTVEQILARRAIAAEQVGSRDRVPPGSRDAASGSPGTLKEILATVEQRAILAALVQHAGNISRAASQLAISRTTLYRKLGAFDHGVG